MKNLLAILLSILALTACGSKETKVETSKVPPKVFVDFLEVNHFSVQTSSLTPTWQTVNLLTNPSEVVELSYFSSFTTTPGNIFQTLSSELAVSIEIQSADVFPFALTFTKNGFVLQTVTVLAPFQTIKFNSKDF